AILADVSVDLRGWRKFALLIMFAWMWLLVLIVVPGVRSSSYGAVRWLKVGPVQIQPREIAKLAVALYLADWMARRGPIVGEFFKGLLPFGIIVAMIAALVAVQPDLGTTSIIV